MAWLPPLISGVFNFGKEWINGVNARKRIKEERKTRVELARAERDVLLAKQEGSYDTEAQRQMQFSWKDEWFVALFSVPFILTFIAPIVDSFRYDDTFRMSQAIALSWEAVGSAPDWYWWILFGMVISTFGLRWMVSKKARIP